MNLSPKPVFGDQVAHLPHLVRLRLRLSGLQVDDLGDTRLAEDMVVTTDTLLEAQNIQ
jgi:hypothetical protein